MNIIYGNVWKEAARAHGTVVVPTNIGYKFDAIAVMGAGVAKQAADMFPDLPKWYGGLCKQYLDKTPVFQFNREIIVFPTKPLNHQSPQLSWKSNSSLDLIARSAAELRNFTGQIFLPLVGCGLGEQPIDLVIPILDYFLVAKRFVLVILPDHAHRMTPCYRSRIDGEIPNELDDTW